MHVLSLCLLTFFVLENFIWHHLHIVFSLWLCCNVWAYSCIILLISWSLFMMRYWFSLVQMQVTSPGGNTVHTLKGKSGDKFEFKAPRGGMYKFCFHNPYGAPETVSFYIHVGHIPNEHNLAKDGWCTTFVFWASQHLLIVRNFRFIFSFNMLALPYKPCVISVAEHLDPINVKIAELKEALESVTAEQKYLKAREARHRHSKINGLAFSYHNSEMFILSFFSSENWHLC